MLDHRFQFHGERSLNPDAFGELASSRGGRRISCKQQSSSAEFDNALIITRAAVTTIEEQEGRAVSIAENSQQTSAVKCKHSH